VLSIIYVCGFASMGKFVLSYDRARGFIFWLTLLGFCAVWPFVCVGAFIAGWKEASK
jgi:hypothetical protein